MQTLTPKASAGRITEWRAEKAEPVFFGQLESFRGFAALFVAWFHSAIVNIDKPLLIRPGTIYVDFFFVLSGFVMMHAYGDRIGSGLSFYKFAALRLARVWPLHIFMLGVFVLYGLLQISIGSGVEDRNTLLALLYNIFLIHSLGTLDSLSWNYPSWSISVEYFTYLIFFFVLRVSASRWFVASIFVSALAFCVMFALVLTSRNPSTLPTYDYGLIRCVAGFFAGVAVYNLYLRMPLSLGNLSMTALEFLALGTSLVLAVQSVENATFQFLAIISFVLLIYVFASGKGGISWILNLQPFRFLGRISYSIYMTHAIFMAIGGLVARRIFGLERIDLSNGRSAIVSEHAGLINICILALIVAASYLSYVFIERKGQVLLKRVLLGSQ